MEWTPERVREATAGWSDAKKAALLSTLATKAHRRAIVDSVSHPAELLAKCLPEYRITPAVEMVSRALEEAIRGRSKNLLVTAPPQELKSTLCSVGAPLRAMQLNPDARVMILTYADGLAEEHSITMRDIIKNYGSGVVDSMTGSPLPDKIGLSLRQDRTAVNKWRINEGNGGILSAGVGATTTGFRCDLLIVDDPYASMQDADSPAKRRRVDLWYRSVARTRLAPGGSIVIIHTRWVPNDLAGTILAEEAALPPGERTWKYINIPAIAEVGVKDSLGRKPGEVLESARGRTAEEFYATRKAVGERVWSAMYQGSPTPAVGGLFESRWFDAHRMTAMPARSLASVVAVDPAETGEGDEAGIIGARLLADHRVVLTHDRSGHMTSDQWAKAAVDLAIEMGASEIVVETYTAGTTYLNVVKRALTARGIHNVTVRKWRGTGDAVARSALLRQSMEVGTCVVVGDVMAEMESQARGWQLGQHQPDRVAASIIAHDRLVSLVSRSGKVGSPLASANRGARNTAWMARKVG